MLYFKYNKPTVFWMDAHFHPCEVKKKQKTKEITVSLLKEKTLFMKIRDITLLFVFYGALCCCLYLPKQQK